MSSPASNSLRRAWPALGVALLAACAGEAPRPTAPAAPPAAAVTPAAAPAASPAGPAATAETTSPRPEVSAAARSDFQRAVNYMQAGNLTEAELGFKQVALQYPQFAAPLVDLALLQRRQGQLEVAETTLHDAVQREPGSAVGWTELGVTQRMRGEFKEAAGSYQQAIHADARYAPAYRNLGVLSDLYLGDPQRALQAFEQYQLLTREEKPVSGWIAELRQRLGMPPLRKPGSEPAAAPPAEGAPADSGPAPADAAAQPAAPQPGG